MTQMSTTELQELIRSSVAIMSSTEDATIKAQLAKLVSAAISRLQDMVLPSPEPTPAPA